MGLAEKLAPQAPATIEDRIIALIEPMVAPLGYSLVYVEVQNQRHKILRLFIDRTDGTQVGIEDCVQVTRALDEPLDQSTEIEAIFKGTYELEVSSPGVDRPLRSEKDYERFSGHEVRVHVYRPLTAEELENPNYQTRNPKQKNFIGKLVGLRSGKIHLALGPSEAPAKQKKGKPAKPALMPAAEEIAIPLPLISKANLEPKFELEAVDSKKREWK